MSNKTSDNVATEEDIKVLKNIEKLKRIEFKHCVTDREMKAERELKNKRIQELEEELAEFNKQLDLDYVDENYIPKQVAIDKIEELKTKRRKLGFKTYLRREDMLNEDKMIVCKIEVLQELLEGER